MVNQKEEEETENPSQLNKCKEEEMGMFNLPELKCERCNHTWHPRTTEKPRLCPNCNSPYWDVPRKQNPSQKKDGK